MWKYLVRFQFLEFKDRYKNEAMLEAYLNKIGQDGWELAGVAPIAEKNPDGANYLFVFKRRRPA